MQVRRVKESDLARLAEIYVDAYREQHEDDAEKAKGYLAKFFAFEPDRCYVAEEAGGELVGAVFAYSYTKLGRAVLFLQELFVAPDRRHKGYGRKLVSKLRDDFGKARVKVVPLVKADTGVLNFYNSLGFEKDQVFSFFDE